MVITDVLSERQQFILSKKALISFFAKSKIIAVVRGTHELSDSEGYKAVLKNRAIYSPDFYKGPKSHQHNLVAEIV